MAATIRRIDGSRAMPETLPLVALRDAVHFPYLALPLLIGRKASLEALADAAAGDGLVLLAAQARADVDDPGLEDLHPVGTVAQVLRTTRLSGGATRAVVDGLGRARILGPPGDGGVRVAVALHARREFEPDPPPDPALDALVGDVRAAFGRYARLSDRIADQVVQVVAAVADRVHAGHLISAHLDVGVAEKQALLECTETRALYDALRGLLLREIEILRVQDKLDREIAIRDADEPLSSGADARGGGARDPHWVELSRAVRDTPMSAEARAQAERECARLRSLSPAAPEASVIRTYLDWILALPWERTTVDNLDVGRAARILDSEHYGLTEVKERILDYIAVLGLVGEMKGPILCLAGPPGVGKTSLGRSIARCLDREFVRISLGGVRDEAEIRGHRRTYVGALPGRVIQGLRKGGSRNPVVLLDEVDKLARDFHGDPGAALLEVLDPDHNRSFADHYLEVEFDLSQALFAATANTLSEIPAPLRDRMEVIRLPGYLDTEKTAIAERFLWPEQVRRHGLKPFSPEISAAAIRRIVADYTREAGVRELERRLSRVARKLARRVTDRGATRLRRVEAAQLRELLGAPPRPEIRREEEARAAGIACGLAWTAAGGEVIEVEVAAVPGSGKIQLTGTLGEVMRESAFAAVTYARSRARRLGLGERFHRDLDIHIHIPEGATPKDGPSAGITIAVALISALTDRPTRAEAAMTGEITLRGRVLAVGGVKEKAVAALRAGIAKVILPAANAVDVEDLPLEVRSGVELVAVEDMDQVLREALADRDPETAPGEAGLGELVSGGRRARTEEAQAPGAGRARG